MLPDPLHPAVVHFPIVLAVLLPFVALWALLALRRSDRPRPLWIPVVVAGALLFGSSLLAKETGEDQEERVEQVVGESAIEQHHEWADRMVVVSGVVLFLVLAGLLPGTIGGLGRWLSLVAAVVAMVVVVQVGTTGGELVYKHGAASVYVEGGGPGAGAAAETARRHSEREDDD
jgi:uncharacterized membrane protein